MRHGVFSISGSFNVIFKLVVTRISYRYTDLCVLVMPFSKHLEGTAQVKLLSSILLFLSAPECQ